MIGDAIAFWQETKNQLVVSDEHLRALYHLHGGLGVYLLLVVQFRAELHSFTPVATVWVLALLGEAVDLYPVWPVDRDWIWRDAAGDLINTLLWPTLLFLWGSARLPREGAEPGATREDPTAGTDD